VEEVQWVGYCIQFKEETTDHQRSKYEFFLKQGSSRDALPVKPTLLSRYLLLARTLFARPESKYASVRVIARKI
jgi:hypothetical protein